MAGTIRVREAADSDRGALRAFHEALYVAHRDQVVPADVLPLVSYEDYGRVLRDDLDAILRAHDSIVLVADLDGEPVGYITGRITVEPRRTLPTRGIIEDWYVDPASRGTGAGRELVQELERRFREAGCQLIESATWSGNQTARRAHDALGFDEIRVVYRKRL